MQSFIESLEARRLFVVTGIDTVPISITPFTADAIGGTSWSPVVAIQNIGNIAAKGKLKTELFASLDDTLDSGDRLLASSIKAVNIRGLGNTYNFAFPKTTKWPTDLTNGDYRVFAKLTPTFTEADLSNNIFSSATKISYARPFVDYRITFKDESAIPSNIKFKQRTSIPFTIENLGNVMSTKPVSFGAYLSNDQTYGAGDKYIAGVMRVFKIPPKGSQTFTLTFATNNTYTAGIYYILGGVNTNSSFPEPDYTNNWVVTGIKHSF